MTGHEQDNEQQGNKGSKFVIIWGENNREIRHRGGGVRRTADGSGRICNSKRITLYYNGC